MQKIYDDYIRKTRIYKNRKVYELNCVICNKVRSFIDNDDTDPYINKPVDINIQQP